MRSVSGPSRHTALRPAHEPRFSEDDSIAYCCGSCDRFFSASFGWIGWKAATYPFAFLGFALFLSTLSCLGYFNFTFDTDPRSLYTPYQSALNEQEFTIRNGGFEYEYERDSYLILDHVSGDARNILSPAYVYAMFDVRDAIFSTQIDYFNTTYGFSDLCVKGSELGAINRDSTDTSSKAFQCSYQSITDYWGNDRSVFLNDVNFNATIFSIQSNSTFTTSYNYNAGRDATGRPLRLEDLISPYALGTLFPVNGSLVPYDYSMGARAYQVHFSLRNRPSRSGATSLDQAPRDTIAELFEQAVQANLQTILYSTLLPSSRVVSGQTNGQIFTQTFDGFSLHLSTPSQMQINTDESFKNDRPMLILGYFAVWIYLIIVYFRRNYIRSRMGISVVAILNVVLALVSGIGACAGMGIPFHKNMLPLSFFLLAIGLGDSFIWMACIQPFSALLSRDATPFDLSELSNKIRTRFWWIRGGDYEGVQSKVLNRGAGVTAFEERSIEGGVSVGTAAAGIFVTLSGSIIAMAMLIGGFTLLPSFRSFCLTTAICMFYLLIFHYSFFIPCLTLDAFRQYQQRCDVPCCCMPKVEQAIEEKLCSTGSELFDENDSSVCGALCGTRCLKHLYNYYITFFMLLCSLALLGGCIYGCTRITNNYDWQRASLPRTKSAINSGTATAANSYRFLDMQAAYFPGNLYTPLQRVYAASPGTDFFAQMSALDSLSTQLGYNPYIIPSTMRFWWNDYIAFMASTAPYNVNPSTNGLVSNGRPINNAVFLRSLEEFLNTDKGAQYWHDVIPSGLSSSTLSLGGGLRSMRVSFRIVTDGTIHDGISTMDALRGYIPNYSGVNHVSQAVSVSNGLVLFPYHRDFHRFESQRDMIWLLVRHLLLEAGVVFFFLLFMLANLWGSFLILIMIGVSCVETFGILSLISYDFYGDSSGTHSILLMVPFFLYFFIHPTAGFLRSIGTRAYRSYQAWYKMGGTVIDYGFVLFLVSIFFAGAQSKSYYQAFVVLTLIVTIGYFNALISMPLLLAYVGPSMSWLSEIQLSELTGDTESLGSIAPNAPGDVEMAVRSQKSDPANPFSNAQFDIQQPRSILKNSAVPGSAPKDAAATTAPPHESEPMLSATRAPYNPHHPANVQRFATNTAPTTLHNRTPVKSQQGWV